MFTTQTTSLELAAPEHLGLESRTEFRQAAVTLLEQLPERTGRLIIDLSGTRQVDSAGLGFGAAPGGGAQECERRTSIPAGTHQTG